MRQPENTPHINPAQLKLIHHSPVRTLKPSNVLGESNKQPTANDKSGHK
jgi:hypothetical protein